MGINVGTILRRILFPRNGFILPSLHSRSYSTATTTQGTAVDMPGIIQDSTFKPRLPTFQPSSDADLITNILLQQHNPLRPMGSSLLLHCISLSTDLIHQTLLRLRYSSKLALTFFSWATYHPHFLSVADTASFNLMIDILGRVRQFGVAWQLLGRLQSLNLTPTSTTFLVFIRRLISAGFTRQAIRAFDDMPCFVESGHTREDFTYLLDTLCKYGYVEVAMEVFNKRKSEYELCPRVYTVLIAGWFEVKRVDMGEMLLNEMLKKGLDPNVVTYNVLLHGVCRRSNLHPDERFERVVRHANKLSDELTNREIEPDVTSYSRDSGSSSDNRNHSNLPKGADKADDKLAGEKKINHQSTRDDKRVVEILEEVEAERFVSDEDHSITLKGLRYTYNLPSRIGKMLYPHQREGLKWLWSLHCLGKGGILGDDMGLGKTMQICGYLAGLFHSRLTKRIMVVAPKTLIPHWIMELSVVGLSDKIKEYFDTCAKAREYELQYVLQYGGILLTTYDIVRNNCKRLCDSSFQDDESKDEPLWDYMVLDEGHLIKNPSTQRAQSLLAMPCAHRIIISGTPLQNNLKELWALFNFCCPDLLGDKKWFKEHYGNPILRGNEKRATERNKHVGSTAAKKLREHIQPYFLRRMKSEVFIEASTTGSATLSNKNEVIVWLKLTQCQRNYYEAFLKSEWVLSAYDDGSPLAAITILKKICDHPYLLTERAAKDVLYELDSVASVEDRDLAAKLAKRFPKNTEVGQKEKQDNISCKISFILKLLENLIPQGHSVLIFSQTRKMLDIIQELLETNGYKYQRIDGTTKFSDRQKIVNDFQEGRGAPIFMLTFKVGGLGLTLTRADRVIVVDPAWNPSTDNQSVDRAYRIGQNKDVLVYRLMTCGTIEEKIYRMQVFKGGLFKIATEHKEQTRYFSRQDLKELFSLPKYAFDISLTQQLLHEEHGHQIALNDTLKEHLKFLESIGIGGISHHSLLYSNTESTPKVGEEELTRRVAANCNYRYPPARVHAHNNLRVIFRNSRRRVFGKTVPPWKRY